MPFRRYGGDIDHPTKDGGNVNVAYWGTIISMVLVVIGIITELLLLVPIGVFLLICSWVLCLAIPGGATSGLKKKIQLKHLSKASDHLISGDITRAIESYRRAKVHGNIPDAYQYLEHEIERRENA